MGRNWSNPLGTTTKYTNPLDRFAAKAEKAESRESFDDSPYAAPEWQSLTGEALEYLVGWGILSRSEKAKVCRGEKLGPSQIEAITNQYVRKWFSTPRRIQEQILAANKTQPSISRTVENRQRRDWEHIPDTERYTETPAKPHQDLSSRPVSPSRNRQRSRTAPTTSIVGNQETYNRLLEAHSQALKDVITALVNELKQ